MLSNRIDLSFPLATLQYTRCAPSILNVYDGELVVILGASGSGKSTLQPEKLFRTGIANKLSYLQHLPYGVIRFSQIVD